MNEKIKLHKPVFKDIYETGKAGNVDVFAEHMMKLSISTLPCEDWSFERTFELIGDSIAHVHIKDGVKPPDPNREMYIYTKLGEGEMPISGVVSML